MYNTENWYHLLWNKLFKTHNYYEVLRGNSHINKFNIIIKYYENNRIVYNMI